MLSLSARITNDFFLYHVFLISPIHFKMHFYNWKKRLNCYLLKTIIIIYQSSFSIKFAYTLLSFSYSRFFFKK